MCYRINDERFIKISDEEEYHINFLRTEKQYIIINTKDEIEAIKDSLEDMAQYMEDLNLLNEEI